MLIIDMYGEKYMPELTYNSMEEMPIFDKNGYLKKYPVKNKIINKTVELLMR